MPYSPLAGGHLARVTWKSDTLRGRTDRVAKSVAHEKRTESFGYSICVWYGNF